MISEIFFKSYKDFPYNEKEILRYAGCRDINEEKDANVLDMLRCCVDEVSGKRSCKFNICYRFLPIASNDGRTIDLEAISFESENLALNLKGCDGVCMMAVTLGHDFDRMIHKYVMTDPVKALYMQAIGAERIETMLDEFCRELPGLYEEYSGLAGIKMKPRFSPGFGDFCIQVQPDFIAILQAGKKLGITLNDSMLMSPSKSVTAIAGFYAE